MEREADVIQQIGTLGLQELEAGVAKLSPSELQNFSHWFEEFRTSVQSGATDIDFTDKSELDDEELTAEDTAVGPPLSQEWLDEITRRSREIDEGTAVLIPGETVMQNLRRLIEG